MIKESTHCNVTLVFSRSHHARTSFFGRTLLTPLPMRVWQSTLRWCRMVASLPVGPTTTNVGCCSLLLANGLPGTACFV